MIACLFRSGGNARKGAPVIRLFPCFNLTGPLRAKSEKAVSDELDSFASHAEGVDSTNGILTPDTKLHTFHVDRYLEVIGSPIEHLKDYYSKAEPFKESSERTFGESREVSTVASVDDFCFVH